MSNTDEQHQQERCYTFSNFEQKQHSCRPEVAPTNSVPTSTLLYHRCYTFLTFRHSLGQFCRKCWFLDSGRLNIEVLNFIRRVEKPRCNFLIVSSLLASMNKWPLFSLSCRNGFKTRRCRTEDRGVFQRAIVHQLFSRSERGVLTF